MSNRDELGRFERKMKVASSSEIELGEYASQRASVVMDREGRIFVQMAIVQIEPRELLRLTLDAVAAAAVLRKHANA